MARAVTVDRFVVTDPGNVSTIEGAILSGALRADEVVAVIGKTPGNGLLNDFTRGYLTRSLCDLFGAHTGERAATVASRVPMIFSGGVEGVLSPHVTIFSVREGASGKGGALSIGTAFTDPLPVGSIGREAQIAATDAAVRQAMAAGAMAAADVAFVQLKGPAPTPTALAESASAGEPLAFATADTLMAAGRAASAFGVMRALGEPGAERTTEAAILADREVASRVASVSGGIEVSRNEVVVLGRSEAFTGPLSIATRVMEDALDLPAIAACCADLGLAPAPQLSAEEAARIRAAFIKCEADRRGTIRGRPHTMLSDGDLNKERHIRGAVGAIAAAVLADTPLFVSGGAEHQGPDGGGLVTLIACRQLAQ